MATLITWLDKHKKIIIFIIVIVAIFIVLCFFSLQSVLRIPEVICLKDNLDFIGTFIARYPWLATVIVVLFLIILLIQNFSLNSTTINFLGIEFQLKHTENYVKIQIKNYLSTKRSIFVLYDQYDNYYDVINSMYDILVFLRNQLANFDNFSQTNNDCYRQIEGMIKAIGRFLTKYQSDYRRYYETKIEINSESFFSFRDIQNTYFQVAEMVTDFRKLNLEMKPYADFFGIDTEKWSNWYSGNEQE